jgi:hypothetical protein
LVVAILQLCFGAVALCMNVCGGAMQMAGGSQLFMPAGAPQAAQQKQLEQDIEDLMEQKIPHYKAWQYFGLGLGVMSATVMVVSGAGLLKMRPWARWLTIVYACYNMANTIIGVVIAITITLPITAEIFAELSAKGGLPPGAAPMMGAMGPLMQAATYAQLVLLAYPIVLLVVMFLPNVRAAFRAAGAGHVEQGADDWEDDEADAPGDGSDDSEAIKRPGAIKEPDGPAPQAGEG